MSPNSTVELAVTQQSESRKQGLRRVRSALGFRNIGAIYVWIVIIAIFSFWLPSLFPTATTVTQVLNTYSVTALLALGLVIPLSAGVFDLSGAYTASLSGVVATKLIVDGHSVGISVAIAILVAIGVGGVNGIVVVVMGVDSFIGTLATGSLIQALISMVTGDISITDPSISGSFLNIGQASIGGLTIPVLYMFVVAIIIWYVQERTATGRRLYATGFNPASAKLAGVRTDRLRFGSLLVSAAIAGFAGVVLASTIGSGSPTAGTPYLLPAFAAVFLGATQLRAGRMNAPGTLIAVLMIGTGITGLGLAAAPSWAANLFTGVVLIAALAVTGAQHGSPLRIWMHRVRQPRHPQPSPTAEGAPLEAP